MLGKQARSTLATRKPTIAIPLSFLDTCTVARQVHLVTRTRVSPSGAPRSGLGLGAQELTARHSDSELEPLSVKTALAPLRRLTQAEAGTGSHVLSQSTQLSPSHSVVWGQCARHRHMGAAPGVRPWEPEPRSGALAGPGRVRPEAKSRSRNPTVTPSRTGRRRYSGY
eukprot:2466065-Rhodomonas_salina.1